jgi:hypothetical protein
VKKIAVITLVLVAGVFALSHLTGCAAKKGETYTDEYSGLNMSAEVNFSDIPVPQGFTFLREESYAYKDGGIRIALLRYKGSETINQTSVFYQSLMSQHQWTEIKLIDYKKTIQQYAKGSEMSIVTIERINQPFLFIPIHKTLITIHLLPMPTASQASAASAAPSSASTYTERQDYVPARKAYPMSVLK